MPTSGTTAFNLDFAELAEEAWMRAGKEMRSGYDLRTARRSLNLLLIDWQNKGINMWTIDEGTINLVEGTAQYDLPADTIDLLEHVVRTNAGDVSTQSDLNISRISVSTYASIPNKLSPGRPIQVKVDRARANPVVTLWPVPDKGTELAPFYVFKYWRMRRIEDVGDGATEQDIVFRFLPALTAGLAHALSMKVDNIDLNRVALLKQEYLEIWDSATREDREKATLRIVPRIRM